MKAVRVQYTVKPEYVEQNLNNIRAVMQALKTRPITGMYYSTYQLSDRNSFMHINFAKDEKTMAKLNKLEAFEHFRTQLMASMPIHPPKSEDISLVGSSWKL